MMITTWCSLQGLRGSPGFLVRLPITQEQDEAGAWLCLMSEPVLGLREQKVG